MDRTWFWVQTCQSCEVVLSYYKRRSWGGHEWISDGHCTSSVGGLCQACGASVSLHVGEVVPKTAQAARWINDTRWWLPLTWNTGHWILRKDTPPEDVAKLLRDLP